jgi:hypothetical protein
MSSLRDVLRGVPQDAKYHPEGDVWTHVCLVRRAMNDALAMTRKVFSDVGSPADRKLLRATAWTHDLGKAASTRLIDGRYIAPDHEKASAFNPIWRRLGLPWKRLWNACDFEDRKTLLYLVTRHMGISDARGLAPRIGRDLNAKHSALQRRARLVVTFMAMDRLGCANTSRVSDAQLVVDAARPLA